MKNGKCLANYRKTPDSKKEFNITVEKNESLWNFAMMLAKTVA